LSPVAFFPLSLWLAPCSTSGSEEEPEPEPEREPSTKAHRTHDDDPPQIIYTMSIHGGNLQTGTVTQEAAHKLSVLVLSAADSSPVGMFICFVISFF
jgi:hypothetical protein